MCDDKNNVAVYLEEIAPQTAKKLQFQDCNQRPGSQCSSGLAEMHELD